MLPKHWPKPTIAHSQQHARHLENDCFKYFSDLISIIHSPAKHCPPTESTGRHQSPDPSFCFPPCQQRAFPYRTQATGLLSLLSCPLGFLDFNATGISGCKRTNKAFESIPKWPFVFSGHRARRLGTKFSSSEHKNLSTVFHSSKLPPVFVRQANQLATCLTTYTQNLVLIFIDIKFSFQLLKTHICNFLILFQDNSCDCQWQKKLLIWFLRCLYITINSLSLSSYVLKLYSAQTLIWTVTCP